MLAWMDLEMTGLDPGRDRILEIATLITEDDLTIIAEGPDLVVHESEGVLEAMDEVVRTMHRRSGLWERVLESRIDLAEAGRLTLEFLSEHIPEPRTVPLCGNSIGTDRRFLAAWLPEIEEFLHYRSIDVSSVKELAKRWNPSVAAAAPGKATLHRALDDIRESVAELAHYRDTFFLLAQPLPDRPA